MFKSSSVCLWFAPVVFLFVLCSGVAQRSINLVTINVQNYGATGNGVTDDTVAINLGIAAIPATGAILYFPCGSYVVSNSLTKIVTSNVTVTGPSTDCVTLKASGSGSFVVLQMGSGPGLSPSVNLNAPTTSSTFTVTSGGLAALGITPGTYVLVQDIPLSS